MNTILGITHFWLLRVRFMGDAGNKYIPVGTVGDLEVKETGHGGRVITACFHPRGRGNGYGLVINPEWEFVSDATVLPRSEYAPIDRDFAIRVVGATCDYLRREGLGTETIDRYILDPMKPAKPETGGAP